MSIIEKYTCPCCGYKTLSEEPPGTYDICRVCFWEDDETQFYNPDLKKGANKTSLRQAQKNYIEFGACSKDVLQFARKPKEHEIKDENWKLL